jgi:hypothetical protein
MSSRAKAAVCLGLFALTTQCRSLDDQSAGSQRTQFLQAHGNDPEALDKEFGTEAQVACSVGVDDYLREVAQYDFAWDKDAEGFLGVKFDKLSTASAGTGMLTLLTKRAKLSNGFGAFQHTDVYCLYNVASQEVARFSLYDPALDIPTPAEQSTNFASNDAASALANSGTPPAHDPATPEAENQRYYEEAKKDALRAYSKQPTAIRNKLAEYAGSDVLCRGSSDGTTIDKWCPIRDGVSQELAQMGMCYGRPTDRSAAESDWHKCDERDEPQQ